MGLFLCIVAIQVVVPFRFLDPFLELLGDAESPRNSND